MREHFELSSDLIYLNSGTHSICPREVVQATQSYIRQYETNPTANLIEAWPRLWQVQKELARFLGARPEDLFLCSNVTVALNAFILGIALPGSGNGQGEILSTDLEYGAIANLCRFRAETSGLKHRVCKADEVEQSLTEATRLVVLSHVCTGTGQILPIRKIAAATRARGIVLAIDGAHAPGALDFSFSDLQDVDFYGGNLHKWMLGPKGTGFGWVNPRAQDKLTPRGAGWPTYEEPDFLKGFGNRFTQRFTMLGCQDFAPFFAIRELVAFWERLGPAKIRARIVELQNAVEDAMAAHGWQTISPKRGPERGPLLSYELRPELQARGPLLLREILERHRLQVQVMPVRGRFALRLSPHVYNTPEEIARAAGLLAGYA